MLVSRDEQSCLIVSYKEVKSCIEAAFGWVLFGAVQEFFSHTFVTEICTEHLDNISGAPAVGNLWSKWKWLVQVLVQG